MTRSDHYDPSKAISKRADQRAVELGYAVDGATYLRVIGWCDESWSDLADQRAQEEGYLDIMTEAWSAIADHRAVELGYVCTMAACRPACDVVPSEASAVDPEFAAGKGWRAMSAYRDSEGVVRIPCPVCDGPTELTVSGALVCRDHGREHYRERDGITVILQADRAMRRRVLSDAEVLDRINELLSAEEWPGASGMEDVAELVALTGRVQLDDAPEWPSH